MDVIDPQLRQRVQDAGLDELPVPAVNGHGCARVAAVAADVDDVPHQQGIGDQVHEEADPLLPQVGGDPVQQPPGQGGHSRKVVIGGPGFG